METPLKSSQPQGQLRTATLPTLITPIWGGWEFMPRSAKPAKPAGWQQLARQYHWQLSPTLRQQLLLDEQAVVITDTQRIIQWVNDRFEQMTGYSPTEAIGRRPDFVQGAETSPLARQRIRQALQDRQSVKEQLLNYRKDQTAYRCDITIHPIVNGQQEVVHFLAFEEEVPADANRLYH